MSRKEIERLIERTRQEEKKLSGTCYRGFKLCLREKMKQNGKVYDRPRWYAQRWVNGKGTLGVYLGEFLEGESYKAKIDAYIETKGVEAQCPKEK